MYSGETSWCCEGSRSWWSRRDLREKRRRNRNSSSARNSGGCMAKSSLKSSRSMLLSSVSLVVLCVCLQGNPWSLKKFLNLNVAKSRPWNYLTMKVFLQVLGKVLENVQFGLEKCYCLIWRLTSEHCHSIDYLLTSRRVNSHCHLRKVLEKSLQRSPKVIEF